MSAPRESPGPWHGIPRAPFVLRTFPPRSGGNPKYGRGEGMSAGSFGDAGLLRRAPGSWASHASARPSRPCTGMPFR